MTGPARTGGPAGPVGETWLRFGLLVTGAFASAVSIGLALWFAVYADRAARSLVACADLATDPVTAPLCGLTDARHRVLFAVAVGAGTLVSAAVAWAVRETWVRRRRVPFPMPDLLRRTVVGPVLDGSGTCPAFLWRPRRPIAMARATGTVRPAIEVGTNWAGLAARDPAVGRAVLAHEAHHVRSRDVVPSGTAFWLGPAVGLLGAGYLAQLVVLTSGAPVVDGVVRVAAIVAVVALGRAAVLRSREHEADLAAARTEPDGIRRLVAPAAPAPAPPTLLGRLREPVRSHPSPAARAAVLDRPWATLLPGPGDGVLVGFSAAVTGQVLAVLWRTWNPGPAVLLGDAVGWGIAGAALGGWVTAMLLRASAVPREHGTRLLAFTALTALAASAATLLFRAGVGLPIRWPGDAVLWAAGALMLGLSLQALVSWVRAVTGRAGGGGRRGVAVVVTGGLLGGLVLGNAATVATFTDLIDQTGGAIGTLDGLLLVVTVQTTSDAATLLAVVLLAVSAAVLLAARSRGRVAASRRTLLGGVLAGVVAAAVAAAFRSYGTGGTADPAAVATAAQWSVTAVLVAGGLVAVRRDLGPQRACLAAGIGAVTASLLTAVLRADPAAVPAVLPLSLGPAVIVAAVAAGLVPAGFPAPSARPAVERTAAA